MIYQYIPLSKYNNKKLGESNKVIPSEHSTVLLTTVNDVCPTEQITATGLLHLSMFS